MNLLQGDQATFSRSIATWTDFSNASLQWSPTTGQGGSGGLAVTATGPKMAVLSGTATNGGLTPATPGSIYSAGVSAESASDNQLIETVLIFYTATGATNGTVFGPATSVSDSGWATSAPAVAIAPANTTAVALAVIAYNSGSGIKVNLDNAWMKQTAEATTPAVVGPLSTSGNRILQANRAQFVPRGVVLNGIETTPAASTVTQHAVIEAKEWGANIIRLPLGEQFWLSSNCDYSSSYQAEVDQLVNWITSLGMVALLDLHTNTVLGCQPGTPHNMADAAQSPTFWSQVAARYAANPLVAFDLYNEPHDVSNQVWLNGGMTMDKYLPFAVYRAAGMQQLYNAVRGAGAQNLIFASGLDWANHPPSQLIAGSNIVYAIHAYTCQDAPPPSCTYPTPYDPSAMLQPWVAFAASQPVAITEFGWPSQSDGTYAANMISDARARGWGWIAFAWEDAHNPTPWDITGRWSPTTPAEPSPSGVPIICELVRVSSGNSPCTAPAISSSATPTTHTATPPASGGKSTAGPTVAPSNIVAAPKTNVAAAGTGARSLPTRSAPATGSACMSACATGPSISTANYSDQIPVGQSEHSGSGSMSRVVRLLATLVLLALLMVPLVARRIARVVLKTA